jgi:hypothetical protein
MTTTTGKIDKTGLCKELANRVLELLTVFEGQYMIAMISVGIK